MNRVVIRPDRDMTDPVEVRGIFGTNLRQLSNRYPSIAGLCRELGINRTQYNRYLSGESFPRPDVLQRICTFFDTDARILLEPVDQLSPIASDLLSHPQIAPYLGSESTTVSPDLLPAGLYRFSRRSFIDSEVAVTGIVRVYRIDGFTFVRGYEAKEAMRQQGLDARAATREFRGIFLKQEEGVAALISRHGAITCTFNFLSRVPAFENNFWVGYVTRTVAETIAGHRATRMVYEHLGSDHGTILEAARKAGFIAPTGLPAFHQRLLRFREPFN
ncbi:helix-turn-helix transcriptional regulator [Pseudooceanicola sp.]|uniref:helix-turn-helix domain-containing protein n=1 Tax=Pseudooceanicola sp. TaxID=1914328 RepID=UPI0026094228|nr:helix-turn-helix transcriptional regulator [Pseudooceanicola sp.]MDF1854026.1 helix-turn-helix transcriptional regulator [Pseudooceanicola sp.]